jgi:transposase
MTFIRRAMPDDFAQVARGKSVKQLRAHYQAGASTIARWFQQSGVKPIRAHHVMPHDLASRAQTTSIADMARHYGIPPSTLRKMLQREGINPRCMTSSALPHLTIWPSAARK